ncbi:MAG: site-specific integrase [Deltaproteobacteria bacterium]|nr:site-specific integrase [Deltaproteobacteria bacterium]
MACIRKRRGKWVIDYYDAAGKRRWETVAGTRKDAEERMAKIVSGGRRAIDTKRTTEEYAKEWLETYAKTHVKPSTYWEYESILKNHLFPAFGKVPFARISREMVKKLVAEKVRAGFSRSYVRNIIVPLREMFNHAIDDGLVISNPASRLGRFNYRRGDSKKINPLTRDELGLVLQTAKERIPHHYPLLLCAARTGMRAGELAALQWQDIDFNGRFIEVRRNLSRGELSTPKNHKTRRIDMSLQLTNTLDELLGRRKADALRKNGTNPDLVLNAVMESCVFIREDGRALDPNDLRRQILYRVLDMAGIRRIRFHDLRHTYASLLLQQGESPAYVKDQLGHFSIQMTVDIYGHLMPGANKQAVDKLDDVPGESPATSGSKTVAEAPRTEANYA